MPSDPLRAPIRDVSPAWSLPRRWLMRARKRWVIRELCFRDYLQRRCIFVHVPKAAGVSVAYSLFGHRGGAHMTLRHYRALFERVFAEQRFDEYFKFTFVRNPWDRVYSSYTFLMAGGMLPQDLRFAEHLRPYGSFREFVLGWLKPENIYEIPHFAPQVYFLVDDRRELAMDFIGRFERIQDDYDRLRERLGFGGQLARKNITRGERTPYTEMYDQEMIRHVARVYAEDIERLGYGFTGDAGESPGMAADGTS